VTHVILDIIFNQVAASSVLLVTVLNLDLIVIVYNAKQIIIKILVGIVVTVIQFNFVNLLKEIIVSVNYVKMIIFMLRVRIIVIIASIFKIV